jgi:hypothetical protein
MCFTKLGDLNTCGICERTAEQMMHSFYLRRDQIKPRSFEQTPQGNDGLKRMLVEQITGNLLKKS